MKRILCLLAGFVLIFLLASGVFSKSVEFFVWLFMINYSGPNISIPGEIIVRVLTFAVTYGLVKIIFETIGWFNSSIMSIVYWIVSTLVGFVLAYIIWTIEEHLLIIGIVLGIITVSIIGYYAIRAVILRRKNNKLEE